MESIRPGENSVVSKTPHILISVSSENKRCPGTMQNSRRVPKKCKKVLVLLLGLLLSHIKLKDNKANPLPA
jgi:hypothetical protein